MHIHTHKHTHTHTHSYIYTYINTHTHTHTFLVFALGPKMSKAVLEPINFHKQLKPTTRCVPISN